MLPAGVSDLLPGHDVVTVQDAGLKGLSNGETLTWLRKQGRILSVEAACGARQEKGAGPS
jgi:hypothetical protein